MAGEKRIYRGLSAGLILVLFFIVSCTAHYSKEQYRAAVNRAWEHTLKNYGISINGLIFVLKYDSDPTANTVGLFYTKPDEDSWQGIREKFRSPEALYNWLLNFIRKYIEVKEIKKE